MALAVGTVYYYIAACVTVAWRCTLPRYMTDVDEDSGGTFVVPGSHRDTRNPRGPVDGITVTAPIPGDMQVRAPAGSVFIQDSRCWHSTACHNVSGKLRVAGQNRWVPWWFVDRYCADAAGSRGPQENGWLSLAEWEAMPPALQPLMRHRCHALGWDETQRSVRDRAEAAKGVCYSLCAQSLHHTIRMMNKEIRSDGATRFGQSGTRQLTRAV